MSAHSLRFCSTLTAALFLAVPGTFASAQSTQPDAPSLEAAPNSIQPPPGDAQSNTLFDGLSPKDAIDKALQVTPPQRRSAGRELAKSPEYLAEIDVWIANTPVDDPQNLKMKDLLLAMPIEQAGPRLVELAKKSNTPAIQENWRSWLEKYPEAYIAVIRSWMKQEAPSSSHFLELLRIYGELNLDDAIDVWTQLVRNFPFAQLGDTASFGLTSPYCQSALADQISHTWTELKTANPQAPSADAPEILRLIRASSKCHPETGMPAIAKSCENRRKAHAGRDDSASFNDYTEEVTADLSEVIDQLLSASISRRIAAIDFCSGWQAKQPQIAAIFENAKNSTEKAHAMRALHETCDEKQLERVLTALQKGDEPLRLEAASIIADFPRDEFPIETIKTAFDNESWPEIQTALYSAIHHKSPDDTAFTKSILLGSKYPLSLRTQALDDLVSSNAQLVTLSDMENLITSSAPLALIASTAESIYQSQPDARPRLRSWIQAQQPFERRTLLTFARFMHTDAVNKDPAAIETMRSVCAQAHEQENILQPCLSYFEANAQTDEDRTLLENLQKRKNQFDAMTSFEF